MKNRNILFLLGFLSINFADAQDLKLDRNLITDFKRFTFNSSFENRNKQIITSLKKTRSISPVEGTTISLTNNEDFLHFNSETVYKIRFKNPNTREIVKMTGNNEEAKVELSIDGEVNPLDLDGYLVYNDLSHGEASVYLFYSPDLQLLNSYKPYRYGFKYTNYGFSDRLICIYSQEKNKSEKYKLSLLDHKGNLLVEREFDLGNYLASDVKIVGDKMFLLLNSTTGSECKVLAFGRNLNFLWKKELPNRVVNYELKHSEKTNSLLLNTPDAISCINVLNGSELWKIFSKDLSVSSTSKNIKSEYVIGDQYIALVTAEYNNSKFENGVLTVLDWKSGRKLFSNRFEDSFNQIEIISGSDSFLLIKNLEVNEYRK
jgi:hypothetical protein